MDKPDDALLWARENAAAQSDPEFREAIMAGSNDHLMLDTVVPIYRAGQQASDARVKVLEALLAEIMPPRLIGESHEPYPTGKTTILMDWEWLKRARAALGGDA